MKRIVLEVMESIEKSKDKKAKGPKCWICMDQGLVYYDKKVNGIKYEVAARCRCIRGQNMSERIGDIPDVLIDDIARINFENFKEAHPKEVAEIVQAL